MCFPISLVGISLETGRFPAGGLSAGDVVTVIDIKDGSAAVARAQVLEAAPSSGTAGDWSSGAVVSLLVPREAAGSTATLGAAGNAAVVVTATHQLFLSLRGGRFQPRNGSRPAIAA